MAARPVELLTEELVLNAEHDAIVAAHAELVARGGTPGELIEHRARLLRHRLRLHGFISAVAAWGCASGTSRYRL